MESAPQPDAENSSSKYYVPANINIAIVGDVNPAEARRLADKYFGPLPTRPLPPLVHTAEPPQPGPKTRHRGLLRPAAAVPRLQKARRVRADDAVFDVIQMILSSGRTGLLYKQLVQQKRIALEAEARATFPDGRYPNLFVFSWCRRSAIAWKKTRKPWTIARRDSRRRRPMPKHWLA